MRSRPNRYYGRIDNVHNNNIMMACVHGIFYTCDDHYGIMTMDHWLKVNSDAEPLLYVLYIYNKYNTIFVIYLYDGKRAYSL